MCIRDRFYIRANEKYGATGAQQAKALMEELTDFSQAESLTRMIWTR